MSDHVWINLIDTIGTVALVVSALGYLAWDRMIDHLEGQPTGKERHDNWD